MLNQAQQVEYRTMLNVTIVKTKNNALELWHEDTCIGQGVDINSALAHPIYSRFRNMMGKPNRFTFKHLSASEINTITKTLHA